MGPNRSGKSSGRGGKSKGGGRGGANSAQYHKQAGHYYSSKRPVGGKGIYITTVRGKESRCAGEAYDLLDEVADRLYPPERIAQMQQARLAWISSRADKNGATSNLADQDADVDADDDDEHLADADEATTDSAASPAPAVAAADDDDDDDDEDLDIEASIQKELAALKAGHGGQVAPAKARRSKSGVITGGGGDGVADKDKKARKERPRFQSIQTDTECLCFIATAWPYDPVELTEAIISELQETGQSRTRYVQRLSPLSFSCHSLSVDQVELQSSRLIEQTFTNWAAANNKTLITYAIEPSVRSHQAPLSRHVLLSLLGAQITKLASPPTVSSPVPSRPILSVRADLKQPDLVLLPTVLRNVYGLSIVEGKLWRGKKFNVAEIAAQKRTELANGDAQAEGSSVVTETRTAAAASAAAAAPTTEPSRGIPHEPRA
ncbi:hypothetical protein JCM3774_004992 [Rhodotorula dairenensis]